MTTMSDDGDRTCPLCAEEMDLTDQQLKPCKCGYEICVWCWHQINDMAEKEEAEGRCPACRTPYDKERIVRMAANCERVVAEINAEKKQKSQKLKSKMSVEAKKHLSSVRVMQRNLVYIIGLPTNLCDESILERKEYFGQYGKVLKVSISRAASSQQTPSNSTCSVYITYAREEEAVRCIQSVHNYVLEGQTLRACFGTTKYCHAWLRNMTCSNPDCLYLHDIGSQEDSFTKDEVISAYTRSRVPQIASNYSQRRSGYVLPPPADDFSVTVTASGRNQVRSAVNSASSQAKGSPPNSSVVKPTVLPAATSWGLRNSNCQPATASAACSKIDHAKQNMESVGNSCLTPILRESAKHSSTWNDEVVTTLKVPESRASPTNKSSLLMESITQSTSWTEEAEISKVLDGRESLKISGMSKPLESLSLSSETVNLSNCSSSSAAWNKDVVVTSKLGIEKQVSHSDDGLGQEVSPRRAKDKQSQTSVSVVSTVDVSDVAHISQLPANFTHNLPVNAPKNKEAFININGDKIKPINNTIPEGLDRLYGRSDSDKVGDSSSIIGVAHHIFSSLSSVSMGDYDRVDCLNVNQHQVSDSDHFTAEVPLSHDPDSTQLNKASLLADNHGRNNLRNQSSEPLREKLVSAVDGKDESLLSKNKLLGVSDVVDHLPFSPYLNNSHNNGNSSGSTSWNTDVGNKQPSSVFRNMDRKLEMNPFHLGDKESALSNGHKEDEESSYSPRMIFKCPEMNCNEEKVKSLGKVYGTANSNKHANVDMKKESSIVSDFLSLDVDPWDDSLTTVNNLARLIGETEKQERPFKLLSSWKSNNNNQSRFSFARQDGQGNLVEPIRDSTYAQKFCSSSHDSYGNGLQTGTLFNTFEAPDTVINGNIVISSDKATGTSRSKISAPPGFSAPSRAPPPGFSSQDRFNQMHETPFLENHLLGYPAGNHSQVHSTGDLGDVEFIDPAILAVGKGRMSLGMHNSGLGLKSMLPAQISSSDSDPSLYLLMKQSLSPYQNLGIPSSVGHRLLPLGDAYIPSQLSAQNHCSVSPIAQVSLQQLRNSQLLNKQWDGWNDLRAGSDVGVSEVPRNERFGLTNFYSNNGEQKVYFPNGNLYNREFGM